LVNAIDSELPLTSEESSLLQIWLTESEAVCPPLNSPLFPNSDWSYGGSPEIGVPDTNTPPLMEAIYGSSTGKAWEQSKVKVYGGLEGTGAARSSVRTRDVRRPNAWQA
jgi:hypothetical protein